METLRAEPPLRPPFVGLFSPELTSVPLDYSDAAAGEASIYLIKYPATVSKKHGTLFVNPGGPGGSGSAMVHTGGASLSALTGGRYDIVSHLMCRSQ